MASYLDYEIVWDRILEEKFPVTDEELAELATGTTQSLGNRVNALFDLLSLKYKEDFQESFNPYNYKGEILPDLILRLYSFLSIITSDQCRTPEKFMELFGEGPYQYIYTDARAFYRILEELYAPEEGENFTLFDTDTSKEITGSHTRYESQAILENTRLFDFVYSHIQIEEYEEKSGLRHRCFFNEEGSYFLNVILKATRSLTIPYTRKGKDKLTLYHLQKLCENLWEAHRHMEGVDSKSVVRESLLFPFYAEDIFNLSLLNRILDSLDTLYCNIHKTKHSISLFEVDSTGKKNFSSDAIMYMLNVKCSLYMADIVKNIPWNFLKLVLWDKYSDECFGAVQKYASNENLLVDPSYYLKQPLKSLLPVDLEEVAFTAEKFTDCFFYAMLKMYHCLPLTLSEYNPDDSYDIEGIRKSMLTLKKSLYLCLTADIKPDFSWSVMEMDYTNLKMQKYHHSDYLEKQFLNIFYEPDNPFHESMIDHMYDNTELSYILEKEKFFLKSGLHNSDL